MVTLIINAILLAVDDGILLLGCCILLTSRKTFSLVLRAKTCNAVDNDIFIFSLYKFSLEQ